MTATKPVARSSNGGQKLPYTAPKLTVYGDLRTITAGKGGTKNEAGLPKTWTPSGPM
jgi:hypothetical protein